MKGRRSEGDPVPGDLVLYRDEGSPGAGFVVLSLSDPPGFIAEYLGNRLWIGSVSEHETREEALLEAESLGKKVLEVGFVPDFDALEKLGKIVPSRPERRKELQ